MSKIQRNTPLSQVLSDYEERIGGQFKPDTRFYTRVGINQKRFGQLLRGQKPLFDYEIKSLAEFFTVPIETFI